MDGKKIKICLVGSSGGHLTHGMTYKEDVAAVKESFSKMLEDGTYKGDLFSDL